jgi:hypothetical protein
MTPENGPTILQYNARPPPFSNLDKEFATASSRRGGHEGVLPVANEFRLNDTGDSVGLSAGDRS